jgi:hypothetical protein
LSGPSLDLIAPIRPLQLCADGGHQLKLGVLGVPLIMVPDKKGDIEIAYINTKDQLADIFTKPLDEQTFNKLRHELNILDSRNCF